VYSSDQAVIFDNIYLAIYYVTIPQYISFTSPAKRRVVTATDSGGCINPAYGHADRLLRLHFHFTMSSSASATVTESVAAATSSAAAKLSAGGSKLKVNLVYSIQWSSTIELYSV
jgi:hypothetical protein